MEGLDGRSLSRASCSMPARTIFWPWLVERNEAMLSKVSFQPIDDSDKFIVID